MDIQSKEKVKIAVISLLKSVISISVLAMIFITAFNWLMGSPNVGMYVWIITGLVLMISFSGQQNKAAKMNKFGKRLSDNDTSVVTYEVAYLGGHPLRVIKSPVKGLFGVNDRELVFVSNSESINFNIFLENILQVSAETRESLTVGRFLTAGVLTFALKKRDKYLRINFKNNNGETSAIIFETPNASRLAQILKQKRYRYLAAQQRQSVTLQFH